MKTKKFIPAVASTVLVGGLVLTGCSSPVETASTVSETVSVSSSASTVGLSTGSVAAEVLAANANSTTVNDDEWTMEGAVTRSRA